MPILKTELGKRLARWQLSHTAPSPLNIDHPVQIDLADAADEIERLSEKVLTLEADNEEMVRAMTEMAQRFVRAMDAKFPPPPAD